MKLDEKYLQYIAMVELSSVHCYKIIMLLLVKSYTQAQLASILDMKVQNVARYAKELKTKGMIEIERVEGRNIFYRAVTDTKKLQELIPGQTKLL